MRNDTLQQLVDEVNFFCHNSEDSLKDAREQMGLMLERMLMSNECYEGYTYLNDRMMADSKQGMTVGIRHNSESGRADFTDTDHTRVRYS